MAELALRQHGVVARRQLYGLGLGRRAIDGRVERGRLHRVHRGVYAVGHRGLTRDGHVMAAVLAGGEGAVVSHRSAGALWGVCADRATAVEITVPATRRDRAGIVQHQATIARDERTTTHSTRKGFERDRERDRALEAAGWRVVRVTWRQLHAAPEAVVADLRALLA